MEPANKRKRSENWDSSDKILLQQLIEEKIVIIEDKSVDTNTSKAKREAWKEILCAFNKCSNNIRDVAQIQSQWRNTKMQVKKRVSNYKKERGATGGGPPPKSPNPLDDRLMDLIPNEFAVDQNKFDSDATMPNNEVQNMEYQGDGDIEFLLQEFENNDTLIGNEENIASQTPSKQSTKISPAPKKPKASTLKSKKAHISMCDENLKVRYLEVAIKAKNEEIHQQKKKIDEEIENLRQERSLKSKAFKAEERRKEDEHFLKTKAYDADEQRKEEEHQLKIKNMKEEHELRKERITHIRF